jgi:hypothetical protein
LVPPFGLDIDGVETEAILLDDAIDSIITAPSDRLTSIESRSTVAHRHEHIHHKTLEERGGGVFDPRDHVISERLPQSLVPELQELGGCLLHHGRSISRACRTNPRAGHRLAGRIDRRSHGRHSSDRVTRWSSSPLLELWKSREIQGIEFLDT